MLGRLCERLGVAVEATRPDRDIGEGLRRRQHAIRLSCDERIRVARHQQPDLLFEQSAQDVRRLLQSTSAALLKGAERQMALTLYVSKRSNPDNCYEKT
jgi:hypothetical protein